MVFQTIYLVHQTKKMMSKPSLFRSKTSLLSSILNTQRPLDTLSALYKIVIGFRWSRAIRERMRAVLAGLGYLLKRICICKALVLMSLVMIWYLYKRGLWRYQIRIQQQCLIRDRKIEMSQLIKLILSHSICSKIRDRLWMCKTSLQTRVLSKYSARVITISGRVLWVSIRTILFLLTIKLRDLAIQAHSPAKDSLCKS